MKKGIVYFLSLATIGIFFIIPLLGIAYDVTFDEGQLAETGLGTEDPASITFNIINIVLIFLGVITLILVIYGGFLWMLAGGNEEQVGKAKKILRGAIIGLIIVLVSYSVSQYLFNTLVDVTGAGGTG